MKKSTQTPTAPAKSYLRFLPKNMRLSADMHVGCFFIATTDGDEKYDSILKKYTFTSIRGGMYWHNDSGYAALSCMEELIKNGYVVQVEYEELGYVLIGKHGSETIHEYNQRTFTSPLDLNHFIQDYWWKAEKEKCSDWWDGTLEPIVQEQAKHRKVFKKGVSV